MVSASALICPAPSIPLELEALPHWLLWKFEDRDGKATKVPYQASGRKAKADDPATWATFEDASAAASRFDGIGFVLTSEDEFCAIDLDACIINGVVSATAQRLVDNFQSYTEVSPSGRGLHIWIRGSLPAGGRRKGSVEIYDRLRYLTVTGQRLEGTPATIEARQGELALLQADLFPAPTMQAAETAANGNGVAPVSPSLIDPVILEAVRQSTTGAKFSRLYDGDGANPSDADQSFVSMLVPFYTTDAAQLDRLFRASGRMREKWNRGDYRDRTFAKALEGDSGERYSPSVPPTSRPDEPEPSRFAALLEAGPAWRARSGDEPAMVIPGILVSHGFAMVGGGAKEGKTWALVDMMLSIANDRPFMGTEIETPGPVLFISAEGSHPGTVARFDMLARGKGLDPDRAMRHIDLLFRRNVMLDDPECLAYLRSIAPKYAAIIADPLVKLWNGDEDKAKDVGPFTRELTEIAERGPVFILSHHTVKVSETSKDRNPWLNIRGSGQWYGALDSGLYVERGKGASRTLVRFSGKDYAPVADVTFTWPDSQAHATDSVELDWQMVDDSRRTGIQEQEIAAIKSLKASPGLSMHQLRELLPGRTSTREDAIRGLIQNGTLEARPATGRRGVAIYFRDVVTVVPKTGTTREQL
jgi:AAA domain